MRGLDFDEVQPDKAGNWVNLTNNDFDTLLAHRIETFKSAKSETGPKAIFKLFSQGVKTNRDAWVWDFSSQNLRSKVEHFVAL